MCKDEWKTISNGNLEKFKSFFGFDVELFVLCSSGRSLDLKWNFFKLTVTTLRQFQMVKNSNVKLCVRRANEFLISVIWKLETTQTLWKMGFRRITKESWRVPGRKFFGTEKKKNRFFWGTLPPSQHPPLSPIK